MKTPININAPVIERQAVFIEAPSERVWNLLSSVNEWPGWQNAVTEAYLDGPLSEGAEFKWKARGDRVSIQAAHGRAVSVFGLDWKNNRHLCCT